MSNEWRHSNDELDIVRMNANKIFGAITDYTEGIEPSVLYQAIYLTECARVMELAPWVQERLDAMRREISDACGIELTRDRV